MGRGWCPQERTKGGCACPPAERVSAYTEAGVWLRQSCDAQPFGSYALPGAPHAISNMRPRDMCLPGRRESKNEMPATPGTLGPWTVPTVRGHQMPPVALHQHRKPSPVFPLGRGPGHPGDPVSETHSPVKPASSCPAPIPQPRGPATVWWSLHLALELQRAV